MENVKTEIADKLKTANNILVTVSRNPSVDQLSACIGLTLLLNKLGKHTAAVFSGQVPSTIEFLQPSDTLEKNTDSLRDFIIALDKSKADKLRYKVEDNVVRIFITPYRTSITQDDLDFSQGDFNVDAVVALGVLKQEDLDEAITTHGRILHDATVISINTVTGGELGSLNWTDAQASSLGELVADLASKLGANLIDAQIATALLTGIVAETNRFSNQKTSSQTMSVSATLMTAGANQQLVATKLEESGSLSIVSTDESQDLVTLNDSSTKSDDGTLAISHNSNATEIPSNPSLMDQLPDLKLPSLDESKPPEQSDEPASENLSPGSRLMTSAPTMGGVLTANSQPEGLDPAVDPLSMGYAPQGKMLDHSPSQSMPSTDQAESIQPPATTSSDQSPEPLTASPADKPLPPMPAMPDFSPPPPAWAAPIGDTSGLKILADDTSDETLTDLEESVHSPHVAAEANLEDARDQVNQALNSVPSSTPEPIQALNAQPLGDILHNTEPTIPPPEVNDPNAPPPVPPPIPFQFRPPSA